MEIRPVKKSLRMIICDNLLVYSHKEWVYIQDWCTGKFMFEGRCTSKLHVGILLCNRIVTGSDEIRLTVIVSVKTIITINYMLQNVGKNE